MWRWCTGSSAVHLSVAEASDGELVVRTRCVELGQVVQARGHVVQHRATPFELVGVERLAWLLHHAHAVHERLQRALVLLLVVEPLPAREQVVGVLRHALELFEQPRVRLLLLCHARPCLELLEQPRVRLLLPSMRGACPYARNTPGRKSRRWKIWHSYLIGKTREAGAPRNRYIVDRPFHYLCSIPNSSAWSAAVVVRWKPPPDRETFSLQTVVARCRASRIWRARSTWAESSRTKSWSNLQSGGPASHRRSRSRCLPSGRPHPCKPSGGPQRSVHNGRPTSSGLGSLRGCRRSGPSIGPTTTRRCSSPTRQPARPARGPGRHSSPPSDPFTPVPQLRPPRGSLGTRSACAARAPTGAARESGQPRLSFRRGSRAPPTLRSEEAAPHEAAPQLS